MRVDLDEIYRIDSLAMILGNTEALRTLRTFAQEVNSGTKRRPIMIHGPSGIGKTIAAHLLADEYKWNVVELNASDYRDKETIEKRLISASTSRTLSGKRNLILLDEIDELATRFDAGASGAINKLIESAKNPIVFIANDPWSSDISFLRGKVDNVEFRKLAPIVVSNILLGIGKRLGLNVSKENIDLIANRSNGDARSAINDFYVLIGCDDDATEVIGLRDRKIDVFNTLDKIFASHTLGMPLRAAANTDLDNDMLIKWIDENIPKRYRDNADMHRAFAMLSNATIFSTRAMRSQYYTYWRYMNVMMSSGVALAKSRAPDTTVRYMFPSTIKSLSSSKTMRKTDKEIASKLQRSFHASVSSIIKDEMRMLSLIAKAEISAGAEHEHIYDSFMSSYQLEKKEVDHIMQRYG
ncbi:MAG: replication factor C large subunit [Candidatus Micrarchaeota archaeon]|nr:replication factor C large subunit [Candidatus Micrarchaeota archaeon]